MENKSKKGPHPVIEKLRKIMNDKSITQNYLAELAETTPSQFSKIMNGNVQISIWQLSNIATKLNMDIIDLFSYPDKYEKIGDESSFNNDVKATLTIELKREKKEQVLKLVFGDNNLEILTK
ncbi:MAG: helix-turn-helix transcriptional regulator [Bacteroidales bacterium]|nr:helix-turn-helix transcriptional regulator [Bacteroidales bacterium]